MLTIFFSFVSLLTYLILLYSCMPCSLCLIYNRDVTEELNKMRSKERYMNNQFSNLCHEYKEVRMDDDDGYGHVDICIGYTYIHLDI